MKELENAAAAWSDVLAAQQAMDAAAAHLQDARDAYRDAHAAAHEALDRAIVGAPEAP